MSRGAHEVGGGTPYGNIFVPKRGLGGNNQIVNTQLTPNVNLSVIGAGLYDKESLAALLGTKAEDKLTGTGNAAYEAARRQMENTDQQQRLREILYPKPVRPVGQFFEVGTESFFAMDERKVNAVHQTRRKKSYDGEGVVVYKLKTKDLTF